MFGQEPKITREFYDELMAMSDYDHAAPVEDLTRSQDLSRVGWCKVCATGFRPHGHYDRVRLVQVGVCESCDFAIDLWRIRDEPQTARINGKHWRVGAEYTRELDPSITLASLAAEAAKLPRAGKGCGGQVSVIRFNDGRTVVTNDLWGQGDVPEIVAHLMPDNAVFVEVA